MRFRAVIQLGGKTATGIEVPAEVVEGLGSGKRPAVQVTINGYTYRSTVAPMGGVFMLPVSAEVRGNSSVAAGDEVDVDVELDTEPREVTIPPDFQDALDRDADAKRFFDGLSYSNKRRLVLSVEDAKTVETRQRRIATTVDKLRAGRT
ncbi:MAG: YdeI/OmpD-associated family protein [Dehalococcoidia bacterium]